MLASSSPRRSQLLADAGFDFEIIKPRVAERADPHLTARELTTWNAIRKGLAIARAHPDRVVLAADTVVAFGNEIIGKPSDFDDAVEILRRLSGQLHQVYSSVFVGCLGSSKVDLGCEVSDVQFRRLSDDQIQQYLRKIDPLDKAGAYAAQGHGCKIISRINGSYSNVVGLPMERTVAALEQFGILPGKPA